MKHLNTHDLFAGIDKHTPFKNDVVVWLGLRAGDYKSISFAYPDSIASTRFGKDTITIAKQYDFLSVEQYTKTRTDSSLDELHPYIGEFLEKFKNNRVHLICYHSTLSLEAILSKFPNINLLNPSAELKNKLDKKSYVRKELKKVGVNIIPGYEDKLNNGSFEFAIQKYGLPFFVQFDDSASGSGSYLIEDSNTFKSLAKNLEGNKAIFMKFIEGKSLNMNIVRTKNFTILSEPSFQIIGDLDCTVRKFGYCGNDFNVQNKLSEEEIKGIKNIALKVGEWVGRQGYRGLFGIDFMSDGKNVYFTEINPRFQGSTALLVDQQLRCGRVPLTLFHLAPYLDGVSIDPYSIEDYNKIKYLDASQILLHNTLGGDCTMTSSLSPGRYLFRNGNLKYLGEGNMLSDVKSTDEIVVAGDIPIEGTKILRDSDEICRIYSHKDVMDKEGRILNSYGKSLVNVISSHLNST